MKIKRTFYFIVGISILFVMLFINATTREDTYFPFIKAADKKENLALPLQNAYAVKLPESVSFAGENVPLDDIEVRERLDRELSENAYWQSSTIILLKRANRWLPTIEKILKEESDPDDIQY